MKKEISINELSEVVSDFLKTLKPKDGAVVIGLCGDLGAGKTTFVKELAKQLGVEREITSPTFTLLQKYEIRNSKSETLLRQGYAGQATTKLEIPKFQTLVHIDLYRFEDFEETKVLRLEEVFANLENLVLIEWADKFKESIEHRAQSTDFIKVNFKHCGDENKREIEIIYG